MTRDVEQILNQDADQRIFVQIASQITLAVRGTNIFRELQERVMKWGFDPERNLRNVPDSAWRGESFEIDQDNSEQAEAVKLDTPKYWAFRLRERLKDTSRIWTTEVGIAERNATEVVFGCRLICSQRGNAEPIPRSIPRFVRGITFATEAYLDGRRTSPNAWFVNSETEVEGLIEFLSSPYREHPIVVFALPEGSEDPRETAVVVSSFIRRTTGAVHSVILSSSASYMLTDYLGREFSIYRQGVRTFNPGFDVNSDLPTDHPFATGTRIADWENAFGSSFQDFLVDQLLRTTRPRDVLEKIHPSFQHVKRIAAQQARERAAKAGNDDFALFGLLEEELKAAKQEAEASLELAANADAERQEAVSDLRQIQASYSALQARLDALLAAGTTTTATCHPETLEEIESWARVNLSGQLELHPRAIKSARGADFEDAKLVYDTLLMMRDVYVPMRREGRIEFKNTFDQRMAELGLENSKCFSQENKARNFGGEYYIQYQGRKRELDWHLKGSNSRDGRLGFRMYYFWDDQTSRVVVGHLPGHLTNDRT
jgi:hypothetical protein